MKQGLNEAQKRNIRKGKGRDASQDLRNRKRQYKKELEEQRVALDLESMALDAREAAALAERSRLKLALAAARSRRRTITPNSSSRTNSRYTVQAFKRQPSLNGGVATQPAAQANKTQSFKKGNLTFEPAVSNKFNAQSDCSLCLAGNLMVMMVLMTTTSSGRTPVPGEALKEDSKMQMLLTSFKAWPSQSTQGTSAAATKACTAFPKALLQPDRGLIAWRPWLTPGPAAMHTTTTTAATLQPPMQQQHLQPTLAVAVAA